MFNSSHFRRSAILVGLVCTLLATPTGALAAAQPSNDEPCRVQLGAGLPSVPCPDSSQLTAAQAQERYYGSYGEPESITAPLAPAPPDETPWPTIVLAAAAALAVAGASMATIHRRRLRVRRRVTRAAV